MIRFVHAYQEEYLRGLITSGMINRDSGFKLTQHFATPECETFNRLAASGGALHRLVREGGYLFYVDRLQGGDLLQPVRL